MLPTSISNKTENKSKKDSFNKSFKNSAIPVQFGEKWNHQTKSKTSTINTTATLFCGKNTFIAKNATPHYWKTTGKTGDFLYINNTIKKRNETNWVTSSPEELLLNYVQQPRPPKGCETDILDITYQVLKLINQGHQFNILCKQEAFTPTKKVHDKKFSQAISKIQKTCKKLQDLTGIQNLFTEHAIETAMKVSSLTKRFLHEGTLFSQQYKNAKMKTKETPNTPTL
jgi:hypothetical protein